MKKNLTHPARGAQKAKKDLKDDFISVARRLGADESKEHFEKKLGKIAKARPVSKPR